MTTTPIVIVEDHGTLAMTIPSYLRKEQHLLQPYGLTGPAQVVASGRSLLKWLDGQPPATVRLLLLDFSIVGGTSMKVLSTLRDPITRLTRHSALHPNVLVIGWSAEPIAVEAFREAGANGFISKHRPVPQIAHDIFLVAEQAAAGESWVALVRGDNTP